jgi:hypothetical protein
MAEVISLMTELKSLCNMVGLIVFAVPLKIRLIELSPKNSSSAFEDSINDKVV